MRDRTLLESRTALLAGGGATVWAAQAVLAWRGVAPWGLIESLFLLGPLTLVPLGLTRFGHLGKTNESSRLDTILHALQPVGALLVVCSFGVRRGPAAAALTGPWLAITLLVAVCGLTAVVRERGRTLPTLAAAAAAAFLPFGALWLTLSRWGASPLGIEEPIVLLTAVHFHFAGFAAPLITSATAAAIPESRHRTRRAASLATLAVIAGTPVLAAGWALLPFLKLVGAALLASGLIVWAALTPGVPSRSPLTRALLSISALAIVAGMVMAMIYAIGEWSGQVVLGIPQMAVAHGPVNALGFCLCGLVATHRLDCAS